MSNIDLGILPASQWRARLDASGLLMSLSATSPLGIAVSGASYGIGPCAVAMRDVRRHRTGAVLAAATSGVSAPAGFPAPAGVPAWALGTTQLGQPAYKAYKAYNQANIEKQYVTTGNAVGVDASGPPRRREPA